MPGRGALEQCHWDTKAGTDDITAPNKQNKTQTKKKQKKKKKEEEEKEEEEEEEEERKKEMTECVPCPVQVS